jgi:hypothetical protein
LTKAPATINGRPDMQQFNSFKQQRRSPSGIPPTVCYGKLPVAVTAVFVGSGAPSIN